MNTKETRTRMEQRVHDLGEGARETGRKLWLAGLGVASSARSESRDLFDRLVERGRQRSQKKPSTLPRLSVPRLTAPLRSVGERMTNFGRALEGRVEERATAILRHFSVPDRREVHDLIKRVEELTRKVEALAEARS